MTLSHPAGSQGTGDGDALGTLSQLLGALGGMEASRRRCPHPVPSLQVVTINQGTRLGHGGALGTLFPNFSLQALTINQGTNLGRGNVLGTLGTASPVCPISPGCHH